MTAVHASALVAPREFHYRLRRPAHGHFPGSHRSLRGDSGLEFRAHVPIAQARDPRRLDIHASLRDPLGEWWVRTYTQRMTVPVFLVADLSASMAFVGRHSRRDVLANFTEGLAWSAHRRGDAFGFVGAASQVPGNWLSPLSRQRGAGLHLGARLREHDFDTPEARSAEGLRHVGRYLPRHRSLVFLVSDFHWPDELLEAVLNGLVGHEVVPVVLWDRAEFELPVENGLCWWRDSETGHRRLLWVRPALRARWSDRLPLAQQALRRRLRPWGFRPLFLLDGHAPEVVSAYFQA